MGKLVSSFADDSEFWRISHLFARLFAEFAPLISLMLLLFLLLHFRSPAKSSLALAQLCSMLILNTTKLNHNTIWQRIFHASRAARLATCNNLL